MRTELRLALVMNGGVSLAVWMGGVAHELALVMRASRGELVPADDHPDRPVYDRWAALCAEHDVTVSVDVVAGTSAGGLNGALLATAVARHSPMPDLRRLWRESASLSARHLLRTDRLDPVGSILDGSYFRKQVAGAFDEITESRDDQPPPISLFVTATALGPQTRTFRDSSGSPIVVPDHRQLYRFRRRTVRTYDPGGLEPDGTDVAPAFETHDDDDFRGPGSSARLALAARASASFPAAFEPVASASDDVDLEPVRLHGRKDVHLMDGGVLNNAPFGPVLDEIARRPVDGPWKRLVTYVVPAGESADTGSARAPAPDWIDTVLAAVRMPSEADLRSGLEELTARQRQADQSVHTADGMLRALLAGGDDADRLVAAANALLPEYRASQVRGSILDGLTLWSGPDEAPRIDDGLLDTVPLGEGHPWLPPSDTIAWSAPNWRWGTAAAERSLRLLLRSAAGSDDPAVSGIAATVSDGVRRIEAVRDAVEERIRVLAPRNPEQWSAGSVLEIIDVAVEENRVRQVCGRVVADAATRYRGLLPEPAPDMDRIVCCCLVVEVLVHALTVQLFERPAGFDFLRLGPEIESPAVGPIRIGDDPTVVPLGPWKLWGTQLGHFAAFGEPAWRMHDWLWGRLDAAAHLAGAVAAAGRHGRGSADVADLHAAVIAAEAARDGKDAEDTLRRLKEDTEALVGMTARGVIDSFREDDRRDTAAAITRAVLLTLRHRGRHAGIGRFGDWVSTVLAEKVDPELRDEKVEVLVRLFGTHWRHEFWKVVRGTAPKRGD